MDSCPATFCPVIDDPVLGSAEGKSYSLCVGTFYQWHFIFTNSELVSTVILFTVVLTLVVC
jgi:hypothetical protein